INEWLNFSESKLQTADFSIINTALKELDYHLTFRSVLVGYDITLADASIYSAIKENHVSLGAIKKNVLVNLSRWFRFMEAHPLVVEAIDPIVNLALFLSKKKSSVANYNINLQNAVDGHTRFPPEPSGYLHIGHAKAAILNRYFADYYHGKMILRFDDTNPTKEKALPLVQEAIKDDLKLLGIAPDQVSYSSDYFDKLYEFALQMIKEGKAYCDDTDMRNERMYGIGSKRRDRSIEENFAIFQAMKEATIEGLKNCLRAKISVDNPNKALRDPVIYRCNPQPHHRTGNQWKIYPTYDFACPIVDSIEGVTHALRTTEYTDRNPQYQWVLKALGLQKIPVWEFGRVNFIRTLLSKRKLQWFVDQGKVSGWDDARFPTVRGIRRRGMTIEALRAFILGQGPSKNIINMDWSSIWAMNKKVIDPVAPRYTALVRQDIVKVDIVNGPEIEYLDNKPLHKKNPSIGMKPVQYGRSIWLEQDDAASCKADEEITLMDWGNAFVRLIERDHNGKVYTLQLELHPGGDFKKTEKKVTWLMQSDACAVVKLYEFDHLITKSKLEENDKVEDFLTPVTEMLTDALADRNVKELHKGSIIQFERKGYYIVDQAWSDTKQEMVFYSVPDGRSKK
ncbi:putative glutamate--tRNA ligase, cytoplasmic, partial [Neolecta irregularis DAH-3]